MTIPALTSPDSPRLLPRDFDVRAAVEARLQRTSYSALSRVRCEFHQDSGILNLCGSVPSYYLKQVAQELVGDVEGVRLVDNQLTVTRADLWSTARTRLGQRASAATPATEPTEISQ
jgi:osmotically-inducible protein OsmY